MAQISLKSSMGGGGVEIGQAISMSSLLQLVHTTGSGETYLRAGYAIQGEEATYPAAYSVCGFKYLTSTVKGTYNAGSQPASFRATMSNGVMVRRSSTNVYMVEVSTDYGASWILRSTGLATSASILDIATDGTGTWLCVASTGIIKSTDNGTTWTVVLTRSFPASGAIDYDPALGQFVAMYVNTTSLGWSTSTDKGVTWSAAATVTIPNIGAVVTGRIVNGFFIIVGSTGIVRSSNTLVRTWAASITGLSSNTFAGQMSYVCYDGTRIVIGSSPTLFYVSTNGGANFSGFNPATTFKKFDPTGYTGVIQDNCKGGFILVSSGATPFQYTEDFSHCYSMPSYYQYTTAYQSIINDYATQKVYEISLNYVNAYIYTTYELVFNVNTIGLPFDNPVAGSVNYLRIK